ncbi:MAG: sodium-translocating pyrophosphatase [Gammaproteobacteria bacterium]
MMEWNADRLLLFVFAASFFGFLYALACIARVFSVAADERELQEPHRAIREAAYAFLTTQYRTIVAVGVIVAGLLWWSPRFGGLTALGFALGGTCSVLAGVVGMLVSVHANVRTAAATDAGLATALGVAHRAGSVTGFLVGSLALASVSGFYWMLLGASDSTLPNLRPLIGLGFGASFVTVFARLGGGIYTKAADVGADLSGKIEHGIPEDDARNPATIADNVGDNVGDCAGMGADVFESYSVALVGAILVASWVLPNDSIARLFPLVLGAVALIAALFAMQTVRLPRSGSVLVAFSRSVLLSILLSALGFYSMTTSLFADTAKPHLGAALVGLLVSVGLLITTNYYTSARFRPVLKIVRASTSGHATNIIAGLALGMRSTVIPTLIIAAGILAAFQLDGLYGIALATCAMLALTPVIVSVDAFGPVTDNAGGIVEMAGLSTERRAVTDALDAAGNTTKALTKAFAIGSAGLSALVLFAAFLLDLGSRARLTEFSLDDPFVLAGLYIGALLPYWFSSLALEAVGRIAGLIVEEVRRQFRVYPDILEGTRKPDYASPVRLLTRAALVGMVGPGLIPVLVPVVVVLVFRPWSGDLQAIHLLGGIQMGAIIAGLILALCMCTGGAAWDNAKKYIEAGHEGGKGSPAHQASITGDTVGDPYKDTAGPAINVMAKLLNLVALLLIPFF